MNQLQYIVRAILILFVGVVVYSLILKFTGTKIIKETPTIIDYYAPKNLMSPSETNGKLLYFENCAVCHGRFGVADGPQLNLAGFDSRWPDTKELFEFIRDPQVLSKTNPYVKNLERTYGVKMRGSPQLSDADIQSILDYIHYEIRN